jgi:hypothetical protein
MYDAASVVVLVMAASIGLASALPFVRTQPAAAAQPG